MTRARRGWLLALALLVLLPVLAAAWLLGTTSGLRFAFARAAAALPELGLEARRIEGRLGTPRIEGLAMSLAGRPLYIERLELDWRPLAALAERVHVQRLEADGIVLGAAGDGAADPEPFDPERFEWSYPIPELPVSVELDDVQLGSARAEAQTLWDRLQLSGSVDRAGRLVLRRLAVERGEDRIDLAGQLPAANATAGLRGAWRLSGTEGTVSLAASAEGATLALQADEGRAELQASVRAPRSWQLQAKLAEARLGDLLPGLPEALRAQLTLEGEGARAELSGQLQQAAVQLDNLQGELRWLADRNTLAVGVLEARHPDTGRLRLEGELRLKEKIELAVQVDLERWPLSADEADTPALRLSGRVDAEGPLDALGLRLRGDLMRGEQRVPLEVDATLGERSLEIARLQAQGAAGQLSGKGSLQFDPGLELRLDLQGEEFDPGWLDPQLSGSLAFGAALEARAQDDVWEARLDLTRLSGRWKDVQVSGEGDLAFQDQTLSGLLTLRAGEGSVRLSGERDTATVEIERFELDLVQPGLGGRLDGNVRLEGLPDRLRWDADVQVTDLRQEALQVDRLSLSGGLDAAGSRSLQLRWAGADLSTRVSDVAGELELVGNLGDYRARLEAEGKGLALRADWAGSFADDPELRFERFDLRSSEVGDWSLEDGGRVLLSTPWRIEPVCLSSSDARLCLRSAEPAAEGIVEVELSGMPLARIAALAGSPENLAISGDLSALARLRTTPSVELVDVEAQLGEGSVVDQALETPQSLIAWSSARSTLRSDAGQLRIEAQAALAPEGVLDLELVADAAAPLDSSRWDGRLEVDVEQVQALALLAPDVTAARGALRGELRWSPGLPPQGEIALERFGARVAALGVEFRDSSLSLRQGENGLLLDGLLDTGEGPLRIEGELQPGPEPRARVRVAGEGVLLADTRRLALRASPDLQIGWRAGVLSLRGEVRIPSALIDLERLEAGVQASPDVVVLDPREAKQGAAALPLDANLRVVLGDDVKLSGFGFDGRIGGTLSLREQPGRSMTGRGTLELGGNYRAYGQELDIERGRLLFASSALDNPGIDLRARRPLREVEVGVEVRGPARNPRLSLWSRPAMDQAEALSWLVLGQPLASATEADGAQLGQAAAAVGGNLLAARIGGRLGFDTFGVSDSEALGGAAFTVGKYLSPKLYLSYGVGLFNEGTVVTLRYLINRQFDVELESARESRAGINYRIETD